MTRPALLARYAAFAILATLANLATQRLILPADPTAGNFALVLGAGTVVGLVVKYVLDKRWIFFDHTSGLRVHGGKFTLYTVTGLFTTAVFWGIETAFWIIWETNAMRETGAVIGLTIGYALKYQLDQRYVFHSHFSDRQARISRFLPMEKASVSSRRLRK